MVKEGITEECYLLQQDQLSSNTKQNAEFNKEKNEIKIKEESNLI